jgi:uncharacterized RmlC-like cupin family protein
MGEVSEEMKATLVTIALVGARAAAESHPGLSEPAIMVLSGAALLALAGWVRHRPREH